PVRPEDIANLQQIPLVPGLARLINLENLEVDDAGLFYELNGSAEVEFTMNYLDAPVRAGVSVHGLTIQKSGLENPVVTGGRVSIYVEQIADVLIGENQWITLQNFQYRFGVGISGTARFQHDLFGTLSAVGDLSLTHSGLQGTLRAEGEDLFEFEHELFRISVNRIVAMLPDQAIYADASMELLGRRSPCNLTGMDLTREVISAGWVCDQLSPISLSGDSELFVFMLNRTSGSVSIDTEDMSMEFSATVRGEAQFDFMNSPPCGIRMKGDFGHDTDPAFTLLGNSCTMPEPKIDLGFARLGLHNIEIESFGYDPANDRWDFAVPFEASVYFPLFDDWSFEHTQPFRLTRNGIDIPEFSLDANLPSYDHDALRVALHSLVLDRFRFPWFDWDPADPGPWNLEFEAEASIGETTGLPSCLRNAVLAIDNGRVTNGSLSADLLLSPLSDCSIPFAPGHSIIISSIGGSFFSQYLADRENPFSTTADFFMESRYEPGTPLFCQDDGATQQTTADLGFSEGKLAGTLSMDDTGCRIPVGMMEAVLDRAELQLFVDAGSQQARLSSDATLILSQQNSIQGSFVFDVMDRKFLSLDFAITDPFRWDIPNEQEPVLSFLINQASLSLDGLFVDGRQQVEVGDRTFGVTFDNVTVDLYDWRIRSGEIFFDQHFALAVSFDDGLSAPKFTAVPIAGEGEPIPRPEYGLYLELGADIVVDSTGFRTSGTADASVSIGDFSFENLSVVFTDDFALELKPFGVGDGRVDFYYNDSRVAYFDAAGFTPLLSGFANEILPEKLPLPTTNVAYLLLRDANGDLVVNFTEPEPGIIGLSTRPDKPLQLVLPILDAQNPPVVGGVEFEDFTITATPGNFRVETGQAWVVLPEDDVISGLLEQLGIPFDLSEIRYGYTELMSDAGDYLQLAGNLKLFEHTVVADDNMLLKISGSGLVSAQFDFPDLDTSIPMFPHTDLLQLGLTSLSGSLIMPVLGGGGVSYDIDLEADLLLGSGEESRALSSFGMRLQPGFLSFSAFSSIELEEPLSVGLAGFSMNLNSITSIPVFEYNSVDGWNFLFSLDADFQFTMPGHRPFELPMNGLQLATTGFTIPPQEINNSTLNGYELPSFELAGFTFQPLALRTHEAVTFNWFEGELSPIQPYFDFEVRLPEITSEHLEPPEGFTFTNVTFQDGFLTGSMEPFEPIGGLVIPAGPPALNPPNLRINKIEGLLGSLEEAGDYIQNVAISLTGTIEHIPFFEDEDPGCDMDAVFALYLERGVGFSGSVENLVPCGSLDLGPVSLSAGSGSLNFSFENGQQHAVFAGSLRAALEGPQGPFTAEGSVELDLIAGRVLSGQVDITTPFNLALPVRAATPFMEFQVNNARLDRDGFMIDATGLVKAGQVDINVTFDELTFGLPGLDITSGQARIASGMGLQVGFSPLAASITGQGDQEPPPSDALLISAESEVILDADGLKFDGQAGASLRLSDQEFASLRTVFEEDFTFRLTSPSVKSGRALVYWDRDGPAEEPLVIFDSNGFRFGGGLVAMIPDRLGLPTENIAYAVIRDEDGNMLLNLDETDDGGYVLQTGEAPLPIYIPALAAADGTIPEVLAHFNLTTDGNYVPNGGSISVTTALDLEPYLGAPVSIESIGIDAGEGMMLTTVLSVALPEVFGGQKATAQTTIGPDGFQEAIITAGTFTETYDPALEHLIERDIMAMLTGDEAQSEFVLGLYGARLSINSPADLQLAGSVSTSLLKQEDEENFTLFYTVGYGPDGWDFNVETQGTVPSVRLGQARLRFDEHLPFDFDITRENFIVKVSGTVSFEEMIGEALSFSVEDLEFGATNLQSSPQLVLRLGAATAQLPDQTFDFFSGALTGSISGPALSFTGRTFAASVSSGDLTFLEKTLRYEDLYVDTQGSFSIGAVSSPTVSKIWIIEDYLELSSLGISREEETGMSLSGALGFQLPDPLDISGEVVLRVGRDAQKAVYFRAEEFNVDSGFDPEEEYAFNLGPNVTVTLVDHLFKIDPWQLSQTEIAVAAKVTLFGEDRIHFGEPGNLAENPGISVRLDPEATPGQIPRPVIRYNVTGNVEFSFKHSFFEIDIGGQVASSNDEAFIITLNGQAGIDIGVVGGKAGFSGTTITRDGLTDIGNFSGEAKFTLMEIGTLELGRFVRKQDDAGFSITMAGGFDDGPTDLAGAEETTETVDNVIEFICFGPCTEAGLAEGNNSGSPGNTGQGEAMAALAISLGGSSNNETGSFSGGIRQIMFYRTATGDVAFSVDQFHVGLGDMFQAHASLYYKSGVQGMSLMAAGSGMFNVAGNEAGAMIAGSFSNINDNLSFGVFAAVRADVGLEVVPGIIRITGFGGGFFYNPIDAHLDMVIDAVKEFRKPPPTGIERGQAQRPGDARIAFAVLLYAEIELVGAGNVNMLAGSTFMEITNQYYFMDVDGFIMGMDGPGMVAGAAMSAQIGRDSGNPQDISMRVNLQASLGMLPVMSVNTIPPGVQFFLASTATGVVWGIAGEAEMWFYDRLIEGEAKILASADGFLLEVNLWADLDPPIITVKADLEGAVWYLTYDGADMPLGAYVIGNGEISALITVTATLQAAFVQRGSRYELFGMGEGCVGGGKFEACLAGWFQVKTNPIEVDGGLNPGDRSQLFEDAKAQRDEFEQMVQDAIANLPVDLTLPQVPGVDLSDELLAEAGYNLRMLSDAQRSSWHDTMIRNEEASGHDAPSVLRGIHASELLVFLTSDTYRNDNQLNASSATSWSQAENDLQTRLSHVERLAQQTADRLDAGVLRAIEYESEAARAMDDMVSAMTESPVRHVFRPQGDLNENNLPSFEIDEDKAIKQSQTIDNLVEAIEALDEQVREVVGAIEHNLQEMDNMLDARYRRLEGSASSDVQVSGPGPAYSAPEIFLLEEPAINSVLQMSGYALEAADRYYSLKANSYWHKINVAGLINNSFDAMTPELEAAVTELFGRLLQAYQNRGSRPSQFEQERLMAGRRVWFVHALAGDATNITYPANASALSGYPDAQQAYSDLAGAEIADLSKYRDNIRQLWIDLRTLGNREYMEHKARFVAEDFTDSYLGTRNALLDVMEVQTGLLGDFYDLKARILGTLYHIIDNYVEVRMQVDKGGPDDQLSAYQTRRQEILQLLEPPVLSSITVDTEHQTPHYFGRAEILWEAQHPAGIVEAGIRINREDLGGSGPSGQGGYVSIGNASSYRYTAFKRDFQEQNVLSDAVGNTASVNVDLRLRGEGGIVSTRQATFNMQLAAGGVSTSPGQELLPPVTSPPERILVDMDYFYNQGMMEWTGMSVDRFGRESFTEHETSAYWTGRPEFINLRVLVREESDIRKYEYAVGSAPGAADIIGWTDLVGVRTNLIQQPVADPRARSGVYTEAMEGQTRILNMSPGERYYVSARACNVSDHCIETSHQSPVVYDDVPPTTPTRGARMLAADYSVTQDTRLVDRTLVDVPLLPEVEPLAFVGRVPVYSLSMSEQERRMTQTDIRPSLGTVRWGASVDEQSGLWRYEYLVTPDEDVTDMHFAQGAFTTQNTATVITSGEGAHQNVAFDFMDERYVHVRAVNHARLASGIHRVGPLIAGDPTRPTRPVAVGKAEPSEIKIYFLERSYDPESGMKGHQYSIGTSPGAADVRPWPADDVMDFTEASIIPRKASDTPHISVPVDNLPLRTDLYFNVRGVNGMDDKSHIGSTGPYYREWIRVYEPILTLNSRYGDYLDVKVDGLATDDMLHDVARVEARVRYHDGTKSTTMYDWQTIGGTETDGVKTKSVTSGFFIGDDHEMDNVTVDIRVTDSSGHTTVVSETHTSGSLKDLGSTSTLDGSTTTFESTRIFFP
ncbi:MAG: hypothetical protein EA363_05360, partial [Balneolaceae bacterium]